MSIHQLFHLTRSLITSHILLIWFCALVFFVAVGLLLSNKAPPFSPAGARTVPDRHKALVQRATGIDRIAGALLLVFTAVYVFLIFYKEDFAYYDDDMLTEFSVRGRNFPPPVWSALGRFYPLGDQEFNVFKIFTRSPAGYHALIAVQLLVLLALLFVVLRALPLRYRALILITVMVTPSFLIPFTGFIYPERNVLFWLVVILACLQGYSNSRSRFCFIGCLVAAHFGLYYKETFVLLVVAYAATTLGLDFHVERGKLRSWPEFARDNVLPFTMLGVSALYVLLFSVAMLPQRTFTYVSSLREPLSAVVLAYVQMDWLPFILLAVVMTRFGIFVFADGQLDPLWDPLAMGALAYFFGILLLRINSGYFMAPVDLLTLLYLARLALVRLSNASALRLAAVAFLAMFVLAQDIAFSSFRMVERKGIIAAKSQFAEFLKGYLATSKDDRVELFFPYGDNYHLMGLASYLSYKGIQVAGQPATAESTMPRVVIESPKEFASNRCVSYREYECTHAAKPSPGALIIVLPDDNVSISDVQKIGRDSDRVFFVPGNATCTRMDSWCRSLHAISTEYSLRGLPEHWLQLDVYHTRR